MSEQTEKPINAEQAAEMLGVKQARTVINMAKRGEIPAFRVGDLWRFYRSDIQAYIDSQRKQARAEKTEEEEQ
jgi:excisionase family DNA binding protein